MLLGFIWALPTTIIGLILAILGGAVPYAIRPAWCLHFVPKWGFWDFWYRPGSNWAAITFGHVTILSPTQKDNMTVCRHERFHTRQCWRLGPFFLPVYLWKWWRAGFQYRLNPMEIAAFAAQEVPDQWG